jgi:RNA-binding protein
MLDSRQRRRLSALAQPLACLATLGKAGATAELRSRLESLLADHELVKLRFGDFKESRRELAEALAEGVGAELVRIIGHVAVFWKPKADPNERKIAIDANE